MIDDLKFRDEGVAGGQSIYALSHAPGDYACPFCQIINGLLDQDGIVVQGDAVVAIMSLHQNPASPGTVLICPRAHIENIYELPDALAGKMLATAKRIAVAQKSALGCDGVTLRQHNEPAGGQDVWHLHLHVIPRRKGDHIGSRRGLKVMSIGERAELARTLRSAIEAPGDVGKEKAHSR